MEQLLLEILDEASAEKSLGKTATYIPELAKANPNDFGIYTVTDDGQHASVGDCNTAFTMQSVVKPMILLRALLDNGAERVMALVGMEATGKPFDAFNYSDRPLTEECINPMINAGAIALCSLIDGETKEEKFDRLLNLTRELASNPSLTVDEAVYTSEDRTGNKNRALAYMLKAYKLIDCDVEDLLYVYFRACSIKVNCRDLAMIALALSNRARDTKTKIPKEYIKMINATLTISGMYDGSGEFAIKVGLPAKSGVGGGIMAVVPGRMGIGIYAPALDKKGNSCAGVKALELLSKKLDLSIF